VAIPETWMQNAMPSPVFHYTTDTDDVMICRKYTFFDDLPRLVGELRRRRSTSPISCSAAGPANHWKR